MGIDQLLAKFDPASFSITALVYILVFSALSWAFLYGWPHYTKNVAPQRAKLREMQITAQLKNDELRLMADIDKEKKQTQALEGIGAALVELKVVSAQIATMVSKSQDEITRQFADTMKRLEMMDFQTPEVSKL